MRRETDAIADQPQALVRARRVGDQILDDRRVGAQRQFGPAEGRRCDQLLPTEQLILPPGAQCKSQCLGDSENPVVVGGVHAGCVTDIGDRLPQLEKEFLEHLDECRVRMRGLVVGGRPVVVGAECQVEAEEPPVGVAPHRLGIRSDDTGGQPRRKRIGGTEQEHFGDLEPALGRD